MMRNKNVLWMVLLLASGGASAKAGTDATSILLKPAPDQAQAAVLATRFLTRFHYKAEPLDAAMSAQIFDHYLDALDSDRLFFVQSDIDGFTPQRDKLGTAIYDEDLSAPFTIFNVYIQRVTERTAYAQALLKQTFDFSKDESYKYQREKAPWAKNQAEIDDIWRKRVKNDWLRLKLAGKKDDNIRTTLAKRYAGYTERLGQLNNEDVFQTFMNAYAMAIEPHTNYLGPRSAENFDIAMKLSLEGIGAVLQRDDDYTAIRVIIPGGPVALSNKFKVGDRIVGVGQGDSGPITDVLGWRLDDVVDKIRGAKDSTVRLEVLPVDAGPDGKHEMISLVRKKVLVEDQAAKSSVIETKDGDVTHRIGVITLPSFYQDFEANRGGDKNFKSATRDVARLLDELKQKKVEGVLVDLRNNGGGSLSEATSLTGLFIDKGPVVQVRSANGRVDEDEDQTPGMSWTGPLAVLVNRNSASASEIFAAAIQDYGRGLIVGENSYGKGTVQNLVDLDQVKGNEKPTYGELKMTIAQFFRVNGGSTQLRGVVPDIQFPITGDFDQNGEQSFDNSLPWTSIAAADFTPAADVKAIVPMLESRHDARVAKEADWQALQADIADYRKLRKDTSISLNEQARRQERDEQDAKHKQRHPDQVAAAAVKIDSSMDTNVKEKVAEPIPDIKRSDATQTPRGVVDATPVATKNSQIAIDEIKNDKAALPAPKSDVPQDDGLQADERSLKTELAEEQKHKVDKDVILDEAAHIVADEVDLIHSDTKIAARVLPHNSLDKNVID